MKSIPVILMLCAIALWGCCSPSETMNMHFKEMTQIALDHQDNCELMGNELTAYLEQNGDAMTKTVRTIHSAQDTNGSVIFQSSSSLIQATEHCQNNTLDSFHQKLSEIILTNNSK